MHLRLVQFDFNSSNMYITLKHVCIHAQNQSSTAKSTEFFKLAALGFSSIG